MVFLFSVLSCIGVSDLDEWDHARALTFWKGSTADWQEVGAVKVDPKNPKMLITEAGNGIFVNGPRGRTRNLVSKQSYADVEAAFDFVVPKNSNSGIKFNGQYEIQILDSYGIKDAKATDCGGVYPRAELGPPYRYVDKGFPPKENACKAPGEWQSMEIIFKAPRFDAEGKKTSNARFLKVLLNGKLIHENLEVPTPTGHAWHDKEMASGPILFQADHGPVAFRNLRLRPIKE